MGFFSQFGRLTRVRVSRSKKTGKAKHYAFLEFAVPEVARIAADAMEGHFMFAQRLAVRCLKRGEVHPELFKGANRKFKQVGFWSGRAQSVRVQ
jgi:nucleolar protein 15